MKSIVAICMAVVLACSGCSKSERGEVATSPAEPVELFEGVDSGLLDARLIEELSSGLIRAESGAVVDMGLPSYSHFELHITNLSGRTLSVECPRYILAAKGQKDAQGTSATKPTLLVALEGAAVLQPHRSGRQAVREVQALWDRYHPPSAKPGKEWYVPIEASEDNSFVRVAVAADRVGLDHHARYMLFSTACGTSSPASLHRDLAELPCQSLARIRQVLREGGHSAVALPIFSEAERQRAEVLAALKGGLASSPQRFPDTAAPQRWGGWGFFTGDKEVVETMAAYVRPDPARTDRLFLLDVFPTLEVSTPPVCDRLMRFAIQDGHQVSRICAAAAAVRLGDGRCVPLLAQYTAQRHVEAWLLSLVRNALHEFQKARGIVPSGDDPMAFWRLRGGWTAPEYKGLAAADTQAIQRFLDSGRNLEPEELERACRRAAKAPTSDARIDAMKRMDALRQPEDTPRVVTVLTERLKTAPEPQERSQAVYLLRKTLSASDPAGLLDLFMARLRTDKDRNVRAEICRAFRDIPAKPAIPLLVGLLDGVNAREADDALREISGLSPADSSRAVWEEALRRAGML